MSEQTITATSAPFVVTARFLVFPSKNVSHLTTEQLTDQVADYFWDSAENINDNIHLLTINDLEQADEVVDCPECSDNDE